MSPALMVALQAGDSPQAERLIGAPLPAEWRDEDWQWLGGRAEQAETDSTTPSWFPRLLLLRPGPADPAPLVVGNAGFHGPPDVDGRVEIGYAVVSEHRRQGFAEEAVRALLDWAREQGVSRFQAGISPSNVPSLNLVRKLGFVRVGSRQSHDAEEWVFQLPAPDGTVCR